MTEETLVNDARKEAKEKEENALNIINTSNGYIFDDNEVVKSKVFVQDKIDADTFAYGIHLPKDITHRVGDRLVTKQEWLPVLISSKMKLLELDNERFEKEQKIKFPDIPTNQQLRYSLSSIQKFITDEVTPCTATELYTKIRQQYKKYCAFQEDEWYDIHTLWDIGTYFFMLFSNYPILELRGMKGTGKTKIMAVSSFMTFNGSPIMIDPSEATLFRETNDSRPTKYMDEAEKLFAYNKRTNKFEGDARAELINGSYQKNSVVPRQEKEGNKFLTKWYHCYSPTMIGSINGLFGATETRALTHITTKNSTADGRGNTEPSDDTNQPIWQEIRNELFMFGLLNWNSIEALYLEMKNAKIEHIEARNLQLWKPLLALAKFIDQTLYTKMEAFASSMSRQKTNDSISEGSLEESILTIIYKLLKKDPNRTKITIKEIRDKHNSECEFDNEKIKKQSKTISSKLDSFGFKQYRRFDTHEGSFFEFDYKIFRRLVEPIKPSLFSQDLSSVEDDIDDIQKQDDIDVGGTGGVGQ